MTVALECPKHRDYKAVRYPTSDCLSCDALFDAVNRLPSWRVPIDRVKVYPGDLRGNRRMRIGGRR